MNRDGRLYLGLSILFACGAMGCYLTANLSPEIRKNKAIYFTLTGLGSAFILVAAICLAKMVCSLRADRVLQFTNNEAAVLDVAPRGTPSFPGAAEGAGILPGAVVGGKTLRRSDKTADEKRGPEPVAPKYAVDPLRTLLPVKLVNPRVAMAGEPDAKLG